MPQQFQPEKNIASVPFHSTGTVTQPVPTHADDKLKKAMTIEDKSPLEVFTFFRDFKNLPSFMKGLSSIEVLSSTRSHWVVQLKNGLKTEWDAEITNEKAGQMIAWQSLEGSPVSTSGSVWFTPRRDGKPGTVVSLSMKYSLPGGALTDFATMLMGEDPSNLAQINLRRLKSLMETGEIPTTEGQPSGREEISESHTTH